MLMILKFPNSLNYTMLKTPETSYPKRFHCCTGGTLWLILEYWNVSKILNSQNSQIYIMLNELQEFAAPGTCKELDCQGRPCANCYQCRDWHFSGNQDQWNWVCSLENWEDKDRNRWKAGEGLKLFTKRDDATCNDADLDRHFNSSGDRHFNTSGDRHFNTTGDRHFNSAHLCLCEKH
ncbi:unnamed protein product [Adineta steineri]|uniref:Uncharacterized protein n=1 Tax=Adineta steineri TaxID=433720 RepID=A0A820G4U5_9BILA|nr:unnamed protein product [Adineta steineri]CAF4272416.1 unnamed protein product [Adineta steineri]